jgi:hypothetical protein
MAEVYLNHIPSRIGLVIMLEMKAEQEGGKQTVCSQ